MGIFTLKKSKDKAKDKDKGKHIAFPEAPPPEWEPAPEESHNLGLFNEASDEDFAAAQAFCHRNPQEAPRLLSSDTVERIETEGCRAWTIELPTASRFVGRIQAGGEKGGASVATVSTDEKCREVCLMSDLPIMAGLYATQGKSGVYYEVLIRKMDGIIAIGECLSSYRAYMDFMSRL